MGVKKDVSDCIEGIKKILKHFFTEISILLLVFVNQNFLTQIAHCLQYRIPPPHFAV